MRVPPLPAPPLDFRVWHLGDERYLDYAFGFDLRESGPEHIIELCAHIRDSKGTLIYAGDILRFDIKGMAHVRYREDNEIGEVWYDAEDGVWAIGCWQGIHPANPILKTPESTYTWYYSFADPVDRATLEVIGNVHQHGHLLT
jgi:hypothetical protein